ncbi:plasmalemma vesicle-associated protein [Hemicordylus capensis]|uniref:plasmalemma vesicle-associated protein n=1 Tax=Hemicordylus capensis TaxID=884348 RepID=UPI0023025781|nr:plasmalemma vesicle-associated protein [Hemicordylus capensis]
MEKNPYTMAKLGLEARGDLGSKRDCGFYVKYFFLFLSLIQFLIILGLVLFMVYGNTQAGTEKHVQELRAHLNQSSAEVKTLKEGQKALQHQLKASANDSRLQRGLAQKLNISLKVCNDEKTRCKETLQSNIRNQQALDRCANDFYYLNFTLSATIQTLEAQLKAQLARCQLERESYSRDLRALQEKAEKAEREKTSCQLEKAQVEAEARTLRDLETKVLAEMAPARQHLLSTVSRALPVDTLTCYQSDFAEAKRLCRELPGHLQAELDRSAREIARTANGVAQEVARLQRAKDDCGLQLQECEGKRKAQDQLASWELEVCKSKYDEDVRKAYDERQKLLTEKEGLQRQLEQATRQPCRKDPAAPAGSTPMRPPFGFGSSGVLNPAASLPWNAGSVQNVGPRSGAAAAGVPSHPYSSPNWGRSGQPALPDNRGGIGAFTNTGVHRPSPPLAVAGGQGMPSKADQTRLPEKKTEAAAESNRRQNQPTVKPVGQPSG